MIRSKKQTMMASTIIFGAASFALSFGSEALAQTSDTTSVSPAPAASSAPIAQTQGASPSFGTPASAAPLVNADGQPSGGVSEVVVTGSRIRQPNLTSTSPLTVVNQQEFKLSGATNVEDVLNTLPQVFASQSSGVSNGASGTATVNLRNLGDVRTLVLVDGRRVVPGDPSDIAVDLNFIPAALIERVDVVTGGASSIYGSDAVAGVVNFVMQHNFQGVRIDATGGGFEHDNSDSLAQSLTKADGYATPTGSVYGGLRADVTAIVGVNAPDDKGNVTAYLGYRSEAAVTQSPFDYGACTLGETTTSFACSGSGTAASARFLPQTGPNSTATPAISNDLFVDPTTGAVRAYNASTDAFNYGPYNYYQRPDTRYTAGAFAHYQVAPQADFYADFMFMDDYTSAAIAPSGVFGQTFTLPCTDPLFTAAEKAALCNAGDTSTTVNITRRNVEGGAREDDRRHDEFRSTIGLRGDLNSTWHYDAYAQYSQSVLTEEYVNDVSLSRAQEALSGCTSGNTEQIVAGCVPWNIFTPGGVTQAAESYIETPGFEDATLTEQVVHAEMSGNLGDYGVKSPMASDGVGVAFGSEYRRETLNFTTDSEFSSGDLAGQGGPKIGNSGSFDVYELFGEVRIPLVSNKPFIKDLSLDTAYRFSDYSTSGTTNTYSIEANYSPTSDIRFRAGYNRAVRAPNINELFAPQAVATGEFTSDPCAGATPIDSAAQCAHTGVSAAQYGHISANSAGQYNGLTGGNPDLQPEVSDSYTAGIVFTPRAVRN
ncbi:MAG: TonB-dependent receptor plug domain-containing protein, partial [Caulobacteraceae bacterium]